MMRVSTDMAKKTTTKRDPSERLGELLDRSLRRLEIAPQLEAYGVWPIWNEVVGKTVARNAQPEKIRRGTLFVKVSSPVWMQQLQFMKDLITEKLNHRLASGVVQNIFFFVGPIAADEIDSPGEAEAANPPAAPLDDVDADFLDEIPDLEMRQAFRKILRAYARRKRPAR
jgi:hypothetical protein